MSFNLLLLFPHGFYHLSLICCKISPRFCLVPGFPVWKNRGKQAFSVIFVFPWNKHKLNWVVDILPNSDLPTAFSAITNLTGWRSKKKELKEKILQSKTKQGRKIIRKPWVEKYFIQNVIYVCGKCRLLR